MFIPTSHLRRRDVRLLHASRQRLRLASQGRAGEAIEQLIGNLLVLREALLALRERLRGYEHYDRTRRRPRPQRTSMAQRREQGRARCRCEA